MRGLGGVLTVASLVVASGCGRGPFWEFPVPLEQRERCSSVDFLFVIDNSESMELHQQNLRASFDPFIEGIRYSLGDVDDFHVGIVTSDAYRDNASSCRALGALVTSVDGPGANRIECGPFEEGHRYMTEKDDLVATFNCTAAVGTRGNREERPMDAMTNAIQSGSGDDWYEECNGGFIRDDGLLVSVIITDEADGEFVPGTEPLSQPDDWFAAVEQVKGTEQNAVIVSLINGVTDSCPVTNPAFDGTKIAEFTDRFTHGFVGGVCEPDYGRIFNQAVDEIDQACTDYVVQTERAR
ncbi:MAG: hypothetical protein AAGF11_53295 [Myxococcota bacterium]